MRRSAVTILYPSVTEGFGTHTKHQLGGGGGGEGENWTPKYIKTDKFYKPETLRGVRVSFKVSKKFKLI